MKFRQKSPLFLGALTMILLLVSVAIAVEPNDREMKEKSDWIAAHFNLSGEKAPEAGYPFSFVYGGSPSSEWLGDWKREVKTDKVSETKAVTTITLTEPNGGLKVTCVVTDYLDFPTVEWTLFFENNGEKDSPILEKIEAIDATFVRAPFQSKPTNGWDANYGEGLRYNAQNDFLLHYAVGSPCRKDDYMPLAENLADGSVKEVATSGGRPSNDHLPYFNLQAAHRGWIIVLGWPGQWSASFSRSGDNVNVKAGQELTHFTLHPGEKVRAPLAVVQPWFRDSFFDAQNIWRKWMIQYNVPRDPATGKIIDHHLAGCSSHYFAEMTKADSDSQKEFVRKYREHGIQLDYWWMDAGWYPCDGNWTRTGTWEIDQTRFPGGFRPITDHNRELGVKNIVWFEPERVRSETWLTENHPDWIFGGKDGGLLNLGNPEARQWLTDHIDAFLKREGIEFYRQDYNIDPLSFWRGADAEDRQGITEIRYIEGYLAYWDELLRRNPGLRIDSCASGGRRNDLETLRRAVPLLRSDYLLEPTSQQVHTYGIEFWIPFFGTGTKAFDNYKLRSILVPYYNFCYDARDDNSDWEIVRKNLKIWREVIAPCFGADYYPLTGISTAQDVWCGWQMNDAEKGIGTIQMFRREDSPLEMGRFKLFGLDSDETYLFQNVDGGEARLSGAEAMTRGFPITIESQPGAVIWSYKKIK